MITIREALLVLIGGAALVLAALWARDLRRARRASPGEVGPPTATQVVLGFVTNFLDTLGIGSFATTTSAFKALRLVPDEAIVGTLLIGHGLPVIVQAFLFVAVVQVDPVVMLSLIAATCTGGWVGARVASRLPRRPIQLGMGIGLTLAALFMAMAQLDLFPGGGTALDLPPGRLLLAVAAFTLFGALLMVGIGNYAPSIMLLSVLGMDPRAAFPIMMGAGAAVALASGTTFMREGRYARRPALGLALGGIPGVLVAGLLVKSLPLAVLRWVVFAVVLHAASMMLRSAFAERRGALAVPARQAG